MVVWLNGGPSHLDLFDPKPKAPDQYRGPFGTISIRTADARFTDLVPRHLDGRRLLTITERAGRFDLCLTEVARDSSDQTPNDD